MSCDGSYAPERSDRTISLRRTCTARRRPPRARRAVPRRWCRWRTSGVPMDGAGGTVTRPSTGTSRALQPTIWENSTSDSTGVGPGTQGICVTGAGVPTAVFDSSSRCLDAASDIDFQQSRYFQWPPHRPWTPSAPSSTPTSVSPPVRWVHAGYDATLTLQRLWRPGALHRKVLLDTLREIRATRLRPRPRPLRHGRPSTSSSTKSPSPPRATRLADRRGFSRRVDARIVLRLRSSPPPARPRKTFNKGRPSSGRRRWMTRFASSARDATWPRIATST